ncbi:hypothetical protein DL762_000192 [Monosporascus cannonballus]|uniref:Alpha-galactosidase n=1 Tax=Monosporascus cannonballus TaxID=155416 RepID=A0ABY0HJU7_9PEZI|nr:hypothetical protein DL762_000192 [Monosporascus cannonballus]
MLAMVRSLLSSLLPFVAAPVAATLHKQSTPPMGWNSYNYYGCKPSEEIIKTNAEALVNSGLAALGYDYVTTDCGWMSRDRDGDGRLQWNGTLFPSGGEELGAFIHDLGLKFGLYSGAGYYQCGSVDLPASLGYEEIDAQSFADWEVDALKYDNCYSSSPDVMVNNSSPISQSPVRHQKMASVLDSVDRDIAYYICQWGIGYNVGEWASPISNSWRISNDIYNAWRSIWRITNEVVPYGRHTRVGAFPDMDMLIIGLNALSLEEERFHFSMWAINKSPLKIGAPVAESVIVPRESIDILSNAEVIAINQDSLSKQARLIRRYTEEEWDIWAGELSDSRMVLGIVNWKNETQTVSVDLKVAGVQEANARDVWAHQDLGRLSGAGKWDLKGHEMKLLILSEITKPSSASNGTGFHPSEHARLSGSAVVESCAKGECLPAGSRARYIAADSTVTFDGITSNGEGTKLLGVDFINYEIATDSAWGWGSNTRNMTVAVNGGKAKRWAFPISGGDWLEADRMFIEVDGFVDGDVNTVSFAGFGDSYAPDLVGFEIFE